ncbi:hypothetical protein PRIPAC_79355 [Pristionchus pacificus]|uniref:Uncharacterized protein n=1 Tax=Pristionchus pacificus TaxID=54126 RepID=A0A2A6CJJ7_PRIPA|nr:hypothetical protein PRIPAC_79355 [Pristionchus pacificus]|eukprot:PDM78191.1 hypothetical protein PRIPAC_30770 [Pristionchus pacificus]
MNAGLVSFLSETPILPILQITVNSVLILIALFLLLVLKNTKLHVNCRFLFTLWAIGSMLVFFCHSLLGIINIFDEDGYIPDNIIVPARRNNVYKFEMSIIFFTICLEVMLTSERALSSVDPESYYNKNKLAVKHLLPSLSAAMILAILINTYATSYCKRRDQELYGKSALNARYQVKESFDMASAMQPALMISVCMKVSRICPLTAGLSNTVNTTFLASCYALEEGTHHCVPLIFELHFGILETLYSLNMSLNGGFLMLWLLRKHPRLRRNAEKLLARLRCSTTTPVGSSNLVRVEPQLNEGEVYFDALKRSWM